MAQNNKHPLRLNVGFLINQPVGSSREFDFDFPKIHLNPDLDLNNLVGVARITRTQQGMLVQGQFSGELIQECVRCLTDFFWPVQTTFDELYAFKEDSVTDSELILPEDAYIDLEPLVRDYLLIEIPIRPICREDCLGLCEVCGQNLNQGTCEHQTQTGDVVSVDQDAE